MSKFEVPVAKDILNCYIFTVIRWLSLSFVSSLRRRLAEEQKLKHYRKMRVRGEWRKESPPLQAFPILKVSC